MALPSLFSLAVASSLLWAHASATTPVVSCSNPEVAANTTCPYGANCTLPESVLISFGINNLCQSTVLCGTLPQLNPVSIEVGAAVSGRTVSCTFVSVVVGSWRVHRVGPGRVVQEPVKMINPRQGHKLTFVVSHRSFLNYDFWNEYLAGTRPVASRCTRRPGERSGKSGKVVLGSIILV